jgi:hypothetical protein
VLALETILFIAVDVTWAISIKTGVMRITRARLRRRDCRTIDAVAETLRWTLLGCRRVTLPWFSPGNALPGFSEWNLSLLGIDGDRLNSRERYRCGGSRTGEIKGSSKEEAMEKSCN